MARRDPSDETPIIGIPAHRAGEELVTGVLVGHRGDELGRHSLDVTDRQGVISAISDLLGGVEKATHRLERLDVDSPGGGNADLVGCNLGGGLAGGNLVPGLRRLLSSGVYARAERLLARIHPADLGRV